MPIEVGIWKLGAGSSTERVQSTSMTTESRLEDILDHDIAIMDPKLLVVGRQVLTAFGKFVDLLAMDADRKLVVIELKRDRTPREVVAQLLDYGSWVRTLEDENTAAMAVVGDCLQAATVVEELPVSSGQEDERLAVVNVNY